MKLRWILVAIMVVTAIVLILLYGVYTAYESNLIDLKTLVTWTIAGVIIEVAAGIIGYLLGRKASTQEIAKAIAEESQKLKEKEDTTKKHTDAIYKEIVKLLDFEVSFGDWLSYLDTDNFPKEISSHLDAYGALNIAINAKELCKNSNADLKKTINDTAKEFTGLVEKFGEKERAEGERFSLQCSDIVPHPRNFYSPENLAWDIYHWLERFPPYVIETIDGRFKIGNIVAETDNKAELESFTKFANEYALGKIELFRKIYDRRLEALHKVKEFADALGEIKKKLDSGHRLEGRCYLCLDD